MKTLTDTLTNLCEGIYDCPHTTAVDEGSGYPLIRTPNVGRGRLILEGVHRVSEEVYIQRNKRATPKEGDLIFAREAPAGNVALIEKNQHVCLGQRTVLIRPDRTKVDPSFLTYFLLSAPVQYDLLGMANGATVAHVNLPVIRGLKVTIPSSLEEQRKVAHVLSAYDTLIENNRKQIKLLEEAARRLYKEWFVDLRFPGHEHTPIVNGIPEGWRRGELSSIASFVRGKTITQAKTLPGCIPVVAGGLTPAYYHNTANTRPPVITVSASGANAGYVALYHTPIWASDCSFIDSTKSEHLYYLYCLLKEHQAEINNFRKGSAQPHVHPNQINGLQLLVPHMKFIRQFEQSTAALFGKIRTLNTQNELLTEARDRLLPKLMSGEIAIK